MPQVRWENFPSEILLQDKNHMSLVEVLEEITPPNQFTKEGQKDCEACFSTP
jgi:hypothetical protein